MFSCSSLTSSSSVNSSTGISPLQLQKSSQISEVELFNLTAGLSRDIYAVDRDPSEIASILRPYTDRGMVIVAASHDDRFSHQQIQKPIDQTAGYVRDNLNCSASSLLQNQEKIAQELRDLGDQQNDAMKGSGYFGVALYDPKTETLIKVNKGTDPLFSRALNKGDYHADAAIAFNNQHPQSQWSIDFADYAENQAKEMNYNISNKISTGHSQGGYQSHLDGALRGWKAIGYDNPQLSEKLLKKYGEEVKIPFHEMKNNPNFVSVHSNPHLINGVNRKESYGTIYRVDVTGDEKTILSPAKALEAHSMKSIASEVKEEAFWVEEEKKILSDPEIKQQAESDLVNDIREVEKDLQKFEKNPENFSAEELGKKAENIDKKLAQAFRDPQFYKKIADGVGQVANSIASHLQKRESRDAANEHFRYNQQQREHHRILAHYQERAAKNRASVSILSATLMSQVIPSGYLPNQIKEMTTASQEYREHMAIVRDRLEDAHATLESIAQNRELLNQLDEEALRSYHKAIEKTKTLSSILAKCGMAMDITAAALSIAATIPGPQQIPLAIAAAGANAGASAVHAGEGAVNARNARKGRALQKSQQRLDEARDYLSAAGGANRQACHLFQSEENRYVQHLLTGGLSDTPSEYRNDLEETAATFDKNLKKTQDELSKTTAERDGIVSEKEEKLKELKKQEQLGRTEHGKDKKKADKKAKELREEIASLEARRIASQTSITNLENKVRDDTRTSEALRDRIDQEDRLAPLSDRVWTAIERAENEWKSGDSKVQEFRDRSLQLQSFYNAVRGTERQAFGALFKELDSLAQQTGAGNNIRQGIALGQQLYRGYDLTRHFDDIAFPEWEEAMKMAGGNPLSAMKKIGVINGIATFAVPSLQMVSVSFAVMQILNNFNVKHEYQPTALDITMRGIHQLDSQMINGLQQIHKHLDGAEDRLMGAADEIHHSIVHSNRQLMGVVIAGHEGVLRGQSRATLTDEIRALESENKAFSERVDRVKGVLERGDQSAGKQLKKFFVAAEAALKALRNRTLHPLSWEEIAGSEKHLSKFSDRFKEGTPNLYLYSHLRSGVMEVIEVAGNKCSNLLENSSYKDLLKALEEAAVSLRRVVNGVESAVAALYGKQSLLYSNLYNNRQKVIQHGNEKVVSLLQQQAGVIDQAVMRTKIVAEKRFQLARCFQSCLDDRLPYSWTLLERYKERYSALDAVVDLSVDAAAQMGTLTAIMTVPMFTVLGFCTAGPPGALAGATYGAGTLTATSAGMSAALGASVGAYDHDSGNGLPELVDSMKYDWRAIEEGDISSSIKHLPTIRDIARQVFGKSSTSDTPRGRRVLKVTLRMNTEGDWVASSIFFRIYANLVNYREGETSKLLSEIDLSYRPTQRGRDIFSVIATRKGNSTVEIGDFEISPGSPFTREDLAGSPGGWLLPKDGPENDDQYKAKVNALMDEYTKFVKECAQNKTIEFSYRNIKAQMVPSVDGSTVPLAFPKSVIESLEKSLGSESSRLELSGSGTLTPFYSLKKIGGSYELQVRFHFIAPGSNEFIPYAHSAIATFDEQTIQSFSKPSRDGVHQPNLDEFLIVSMYGDVGLPGKRSKTLKTGSVAVADERFPGVYPLLSQSPDSILMFNSHTYEGEPILTSRKDPTLDRECIKISKRSSERCRELRRLQSDWSEEYYRTVAYLGLNTTLKSEKISNLLGRELRVFNPSSIESLWLQARLFKMETSKKDFSAGVGQLMQLIEGNRSLIV